MVTITRARWQAATAAIVGMLAGYAVWLGGATAIAVMTPVHIWAQAGALLLAILIVVAFVSGRRAPSMTFKQFCWWSPLLPVVASAYALVLVLW